MTEIRRWKGAVGGNYYSVPDRTRRLVEIQQLPDIVRILDLGAVVAEHPVLEGRKQSRIDRSHRTGGSGVRRTGVETGKFRPVMLHTPSGARSRKSPAG